MSKQQRDKDALIEVLIDMIDDLENEPGKYSINNVVWALQIAISAHGQE